ncbi:MAG: hypothetical protein P1V97_13475, partial [Planctomycetota bacterium]|nr:hypothetical protein [Planctomycetota bacterium]
MKRQTYSIGLATFVIGLFVAFGSFQLLVVDKDIDSEPGATSQTDPHKRIRAKRTDLQESALREKKTSENLTEKSSGAEKKNTKRDSKSEGESSVSLDLEGKGWSFRIDEPVVGNTAKKTKVGKKGREPSGGSAISGKDFLKSNTGAENENKKEAVFYDFKGRVVDSEGRAIPNVKVYFYPAIAAMKIELSSHQLRLEKDP